MSACGSPGDSVEHLELPVCFIPSGTQNGFTAEKTPVLHAYSFLSLKKPRFSWTEIKLTSLCAQADMQAETWNTAETGRVDISGSHPRGQQDGVQPDGKTHVVWALPIDFSSRLWFGSRMFGVLPGSQRTASQQAAPPVDG